MKAKKQKPINPVKLASAEKKIEELEGSLKALAEQLANPEIYQEANAKEREGLYEQQKKQQKALKKAEDEWTKLQNDS